MCLAVPGRIETLTDDTDPLTRAGTVSFSGLSKTINLALVPEARAGDYVLVHAGIAIQRIDEAAAELLLASLAEIDP